MATVELDMEEIPLPYGIPETSLLRKFKQHAKVIFCVLAFAAVSAASVWLSLPEPKSSATVVFHIAHQRQQLLPGSPVDGGDDYLAYKQSQIALLKSRRI